MKKFLIPVLSIMLLLPFMYGGCLSTEDLAEQFFDINLPDLTGTWQGPGHWFGSELTENFVDIVLTLESDGDISNATLNGLSFADVLNTNTAVTGTVSHFEADLVEFNFSNNYTGGIIFDSSDLKYLYFFSHDVVDNPFADGTLQNGGTTFSGTPPDLVGSWSGFGFEFDDIAGTAEKFTLTDFVVTMPEGLMVTGTDPDGNSFTGTLTPHAGFNTNGSFFGEMNVTSVGYVGIYYAFMSPDKQVIGFLSWGSSGWSAVLLKKQ